MKNNYRWWIFSAGALAFIASNAFTIFEDKETSLGMKAVELLAVAASIGSHFLTLFLVSAWMQKRFPGLALTRRRISRTLLVGVPAVSFLIGLGDYGQAVLNQDPLPSHSPGAILALICQGLAIAIFIVGISEAFYQYQQLRQSEKEKEDLLRLNLLAQYDSLKQQVNPHFLFNSLNSLSALIASDPPKAEQFVEEMSGVYRYLLQSSRDELATLGAELEFVRSYLHLLKTRFGEALRVNVNVPAHYFDRQIPPLTLQLLIENAVKHNEVSAAHPLQLYLDIAPGERLRVANNLQPKTVSVPSEKIGLANIMAKYRLLHQPEVDVQNTGEDFIVLLPLIQPAHIP